MKTKEEIISFIKTFLGYVVTGLALGISVLPPENLTNIEFYKSGGAVALLGSAIRTAISLLWKKTLPVKIGGEKK